MLTLISTAESIASFLCGKTARSSPWRFEQAQEKTISQLGPFNPMTPVLLPDSSPVVGFMTRWEYYRARRQNDIEACMLRIIIVGWQTRKIGCEKYMTTWNRHISPWEDNGCYALPRQEILTGNEKDQWQAVVGMKSGKYTREWELWKQFRSSWALRKTSPKSV